MGIGYNYSTLRPKGTVTSNHGIASGVVSFMTVFNAQTHTVVSMNRRGAQMAILDVYHPDIFDFIDAKQHDSNILQYFNMSVMVDDEFLKAVDQNEQIALRFPVYDNKGNLLPPTALGTKIYKWVDAKLLWDKIVHNAYNTGEPGVFFRDNINNVNPLQQWENAIVTNPCVTGDTLIYTNTGNHPIKDLVDRTVKIWNGYQWSKVIPHKTGEHQPIMKITFAYRENNGKERIVSHIHCTPYHKFILKGKTERVEAQNLQNGDIIQSYDLPSFDWNGVLNIDTKIHMESIYVQEVKLCQGKTDVYCLNEPLNHSFIANGILTGNCGEFIGSIVGEEIQQKRPGEYGGSCNLGSLYLHSFVKNPFTAEAYLDILQLCSVIDIFVEALDRIIDINYYPLEMFENYQKMFRTIGLGITGLADVLAMLGLNYCSQEAKQYVQQLMESITFRAYQRSVELAEEKGPALLFDLDDNYQSEYASNGFLKAMVKLSPDPAWERLINRIKSTGIRNTKIMSIAPVGTGSLVWGNNCSSGIEPIFSLEYTREVKIGGQNDENKQKTTLRDYAWEQFKVEAGKREKAVARGMDKEEYEVWYNMYRRIFVTALEMTPEEHVDMLGVIAPYVDMSISKTINIPSNYSFEATKDIYRKCHKLGIKGCTIFRPNEIRQGVLLNSSESPKTNFNSLNGTSKTVITTIEDLQWGDTLLDSDEDFGKRRKLITGCGSLHVTAFFNPESGELMSTYLNKGSTGGCNNFMIGLSRMISAAVKRGMTIEEVVDQLSSCGVCPSYATRTAVKGDTSKGSSCPVAVGYALKEMYHEAKEELNIDNQNTKGEEFDSRIEDFNFLSQSNMPLCPECGEPLIMEGGCNICKACGYSKCG